MKQTKIVKKTKIICGFPGVGKTRMSTRREILDMESTPFSWIWDPENFEEYPKQNSEFPKNYVDAIIEEYEKDELDYLLISSHESIRNELKNRGVPYIIIAPNREAKNDYLIRYLRRGSAIEFIEMMNGRWDEFIDSITNDGQPVIWIDCWQYLSEVLGVE